MINEIMPCYTLRYVIDSLAIGGTERHLSYVLPELTKQGLTIHVVVLQAKQDNEIVAVLEKTGIRLSFYPAALNLKKLPVSIQRGLTAVVNFIRLWVMFIKDRQSYTHFFLPRSYILGGIAAKLAFLSSPQIMSRRSLNDYQRRYPYLRYVEIYLHRRMDMILANSQAVMQQLHEVERVPYHRCALIYNGVPRISVSLTTQTHLRQQLHLTRHHFVIVMVANFIPYKGHQDLLAALSHIHQALPQHWVCLMVGRDEGILAFLQKTTEHLGIASHVQWLGVREDIAPLLSISSVSVLCSYEEGFSNVILESMAQCCALVVTAVGGNTESVIHQETGLVVPPRQPQQLGEAILNLYHDPLLRKRLGREAQQRVQTMFSLEKCVKRYKEIYDNLL